MTNKLKPEIKRKWLAALRSGEFKQGQGALYRDGLYCCLGVLCEVVAKEQGYDFDEFANEEQEMPNEVLVATVFGDKPRATWEWKVTPHRVNARPTTLPVLNDSGEFTFGQIANLIEEQL
jgi:hypothetical protein